MRIFIDTNVAYDLLGERFPYYNDIAKIISYADKKKLEIFVSPVSFATLNYFISKFEGNKIALNKLRIFKSLTRVSEMNELIVEKALNSNFSDFEDALQHFSALEMDCELIITRDKKDFKNSLIPFLSPRDFVKTLEK